MVLGIDLVVGAGLVDINPIHYMEIMPSVEDTALLKVRLELILTVALVLQKLAVDVGYLFFVFVGLWSKTYSKFS